MPASRPRKNKKRTPTTTAPTPTTWNPPRAARTAALHHADILDWLLPDDTARPGNVTLMREEVRTGLTTHAHLGADALAINLHCNLGLDITPEQVRDPETHMPAIIDQWIELRAAGLEAAAVVTTSPEAQQVILAAANAYTDADVLAATDAQDGRFGHGYIHLPDTVTYARPIGEVLPPDGADPIPVNTPHLQTLAAIAFMDGAVTPRTADGVLQDGATIVPRLLLFSPVEFDSPSAAVQSHLEQVDRHGAAAPYLHLNQEGWIATSAAVLPPGYDPQDPQTTPEPPPAPTGTRYGTSRHGHIISDRDAPLPARIILALHALTQQGILEGQSVASARDRRGNDLPPAHVFTLAGAKKPRADRMPAHTAWSPQWQVSITATAQEDGLHFDPPQMERAAA